MPALNLEKLFNKIARLKNPSQAFTELAANFVDSVGNPTRMALEAVPYLLAIVEKPEQHPHTADALHMLAGAASLDATIRNEVDKARPLYRRWARQGSPEVRAAAQRLLPQKPQTTIQLLQNATSFTDACNCALALLREVTNDTRPWTGGGSVSSVGRINGRILEYGFWLETNPHAHEILAQIKELEEHFEREKPPLEQAMAFGERLQKLQQELHAYPPEADVRKQYQFSIPRGAKPVWCQPLTSAQIKALRAIVKCDPLWTGDTNLWAAFRLPSKREKLRELLHSAA